VLLTEHSGEQVVSTVDPFGLYATEIETGLNDAFVNDAFGRVHSTEGAGSPASPMKQLHSEDAPSTAAPAAGAADDAAPAGNNTAAAAGANHPHSIYVGSMPCNSADGLAPCFVGLCGLTPCCSWTLRVSACQEATLNGALSAF